MEKKCYNKLSWYSRSHLKQEKNFFEEVFKMTLASKLMAISQTHGAGQEPLITSFSKDIEGHQEEKILRGCLIQARLHRGYLDFGRNMFTPQGLKAEGFKMFQAGPGFHLHFDRE